MRLATIALLGAAALLAQSTAGLLVSFDDEHDLAAKERLLRTITGQGPGAGPALLKLARSTANIDTRWMAMRGMATLHYTAAAPFLKASLKSRDVLVRANAPLLREKIPRFAGQTRAWLIQALGALGTRADVPLVAGYLEDRVTSGAATEALENLTGSYFGPRPVGLASDPTPATLAAQAWWKAHSAAWPH